MNALPTTPNDRCPSASEEKVTNKEKVESVSDELEVYSFKEFLEHHADDYSSDLLVEYEAQLEDKFKLREIQIFLRSKGKVARANTVQSYNDLYTHDREDWEEFEARPWALRPTVGPYDDYQLLVAHDPFDEPSDGYRSLYCSYESDIAYLKFFEDLKKKVEWKMSWEDSWEIAEDTLKNYEKIDPFAVSHAIEDCRRWSYLEARKDEMIPVYATLWQEVIMKGRHVKGVLKEILDNDMRPYPRYKNFIDDCLRIGNVRCFLRPLDQLKEYITANPEEYCVCEDMKDTVRKFLEEEPPTLDMCTYAKYVQKKMQLTKSLGIISS